MSSCDELATLTPSGGFDSFFAAIAGAATRLQSTNVDASAIVSAGAKNKARKDFILIIVGYGNVNPDRAFTAEMSDALMTPVAFTSNLKFDAVAV